jgi:hypothetical protein
VTIKYEMWILKIISFASIHLYALYQKFNIISFSNDFIFSLILFNVFEKYIGFKCIGFFFLF